MLCITNQCLTTLYNRFETDLTIQTPRSESSPAREIPGTSLFGKLLKGIIVLYHKILACALKVFQQSCENAPNILLQTSPSLCSQDGGARCH